MRRRRNPFSASNAIMLGGLAVVAYFVYQFTKPGGPTDKFAQYVANWWVNLTSPPSPVPQGNVIMPDETYFPTSDLTNMNEEFVGNSLQFTYSDGHVYQLSPQSGGNYQATLVQ